MPKEKAIKVQVKSTPLLMDGKYDVLFVNELNFFDLTGEKAKVKGTSNKMYHAELHISKDKKSGQIMTIFGPTGQAQRKDYRHYTEDGDVNNGIGKISFIEKEYNSILDSKRKKGYKDIDVAQRSLGSDDAKKIIKPVELKNTDQITNNSLHVETARIISTIMQSTNAFVLKTLKCPLGQLSNQQIDAGRDCLNKARDILKNSNKNDEIEKLTNDFYGLIPHNLGSGARGQMTHLLLDSLEKINQKEYDLDTLLDAKSIGDTLSSNVVYDQYVSLETSFDFIDHKDSLFKWLNDMIQETRASNHKHLGKIVLLNAWSIQRNNERNSFLKTAEKIADECGKQIIPDQMKDLVKSRKDIDNVNLYKRANIIPLFHGTRTENLSGILKKGMLIRPSGVVITGAMYGNAIYKSNFSTKSINYTNIKSSYWAKGQDNNAFLFLSDCALGNQLIASGPKNYSLNSIKPYHSVWAKSGQSGIINDEFMLYKTDQHNIRYLLEFTTK